MEFTKEQIEQIVTAALESAKDELGNETVSRAKFHIGHAVERNVNGIVDNWFETDVGPAIVDALADNREGIVTGAIQAAGEVAEALAVALVKHAVKNLGDPYKRRDIISALFK